MAAAACELIGEARGQSARLGRPPRWAWRYRPRPESVLLDLALQAAGAVPVPVGAWAPQDVAPKDTATEDTAPEDAAPDDLDGWIERPAALDLERKSPREAVWPEVEAGDVATETLALGVRTEAGEPGRIPTAGLIEAAGELAARMPAATRGRDVRNARDVWVSARPLDDPVERLLMTWSLLVGAAVVLEPRPGSLVPTAAWVRPTVFAGDASEIAALVAAAEAYRSPFPRRWLRGLLRRLGRPSAPGLPFDRLRTVVLCRDRELSGPARTFLQERGVRVLRPSFDPRSVPDAATWRASYNIEAPGEEPLGGDT